MDGYVYDDETGELLAQGNHVKFMINHFVLNTVTHVNSILRPFLIPYLISHFTKSKKNAIRITGMQSSYLLVCVFVLNLPCLENRQRHD